MGTYSQSAFTVAKVLLNAIPKQITNISSLFLLSPDIFQLFGVLRKDPESPLLP